MCYAHTLFLIVKEQMTSQLLTWAQFTMHPKDSHHLTDLIIPDRGNAYYALHSELHNY